MSGNPDRFFFSKTISNDNKIRSSENNTEYKDIRNNWLSGSFIRNQKALKNFGNIKGRIRFYRRKYQQSVGLSIIL